jgi:hypothetical protein
VIYPAKTVSFEVMLWKSQQATNVMKIYKNKISTQQQFWMEAEARLKTEG